MTTTATERLASRLAINHPLSVIEFAKQRALSPLVYVTWQAGAKRKQIPAAWLVNYLGPRAFEHDRPNCVFEVEMAGERTEIREQALTWAASHYGVQQWARLTGMSHAYFPANIVQAVKRALRATETKPENTTRGRKPMRGDAPLTDHIVEAMHALTTEGMTWSEVSTLFDCHHGVSSGHLSILHEDGTLARLSQKRGGQRIYVLPEYVNGRETESYGIDKRHLTDAEDEALITIKTDLIRGHRSDPINVRFLVEALERIMP